MNNAVAATPPAREHRDRVEDSSHRAAGRLARWQRRRARESRRAPGWLRGARSGGRHRFPRARPGSGRPDRLGDGGGRPEERRRTGRARDGGNRLRRVRGQGDQELHRHRVPLRLPEGQALGRRDRRGSRARHPGGGRADRGGARAHADHEPHLHRAVQVHRGGEDPQRDRLPAIGARRPLRPAGCGDTAGVGRARRAPARGAAGDPRSHAGRIPVPVPSPGRGLHLDHRRSQGRRRGERGGQAVHQRGPRQRAGLHPPQRRRAHGGRGHAHLEDL